ncbi:hypothetical protein [Anaerosporobacter sp.]|uniref:hypothetical protein n=1 Tax=Anaerosporobacter sp. TaxID=1872529 RepID=UPI00286EEC19|nr:hypothetical protein [Anaerosporobacter sp.]
MNMNEIPTITFAYFEISINCIQNFLNGYLEKRINNQETFISLEKKDINKFLIEWKKIKELQIYKKEYSSALFYNPLISDEKTIMISNLADGWYTLCNVIANNLNCAYYLFTLSDEKDSEPMNSFRYKNNGIKRSIYAMKEGKWYFYSEGEPLYFEEQKHYENKMIKKRLTKQILIDYCKELGLFIENENFWKTEKESLYLKNVYNVS